MRILGVDYGERRIGLSMSDELGLLAHGMPTLANKSPAQVLEELSRIVVEHNVSEIVVGLPKNMNGSLGPQAQKVIKFAESLKATGKPVHLVDERLTTQRAQRTLTRAGMSRAKRKHKVDRLAAHFILQLYLDSTPKNNQPND